MELVHQFFRNNLDMVFFFYGLAFVVMGTAILIQPRVGSRYELAGIFWLLGIFGLAHGANEFLDMLVIIKGRGETLDPIRLVFLVASFLFLLEFGRRLLRADGQQQAFGQKAISRIFGWWLSPVVVVLVVILGFASGDFWRSAGIWARYLLGFPGSLLTAIGFFSYYRHEKENLRPLKARKYFVWAGWSFLFYSILSGLIASRGNFFPSSWLNTDSFLSATRIPVQVFRAASALMVAWAVTGILGVFNREATWTIKREIAERRETEEELKKHREYLEELVKERVAQLTAVNEQLQEGMAERERTQAELLMFKLGIERSGEVIFLTDVEGTIIYANPAFEKVYGFSQEEVLGKTPRILKSGTYAEGFYKEFWETLLAKKEKVGEITNKTKDGRLVDVEGSANPILDKDNNIVGFLAIQRDITERKHAEEALKMEAQLLDADLDSITVHDFEGNFLYANETAYKSHGYNKEEFVAINLHALDVPEQARLIEPRIKKLMETGEAIFESAHFRKDGSVVPVEVHARIIELGGKMVILSVARDITERKRTETELQDTLEKLRASLSGTIQVISVTVETKDPYTAGHQRRVADLGRAIAQEMGLSENQVDCIRMAGTIHDIGKISVPGEILSKPGQISEAEMNLVRNHPQVGYDILKTIEFPYPVAQTVLQHHERMNGSGYPLGLLGEDILLEARILAVADVVEAMASHRPYRPSLGVGQALDEISRNKGVLYDSGAVDACLRLFIEKGFEFDRAMVGSSLVYG